MKDRALVPGRADEETMLRLMNDHSAALLGVCRAMLGDWALAQDVTQETFVKAWQLGGPPEGAERAWLIRVAVNACRDELRSRWLLHTDRRVTPEDLPLAAPEPEEMGVFDQVMKLLVLTAATALAVGLTQGTVNWKGENVEEERVMVASTLEPDEPEAMQAIDENALEQAMIEQQSALKAGEMLIGIQIANGEAQYSGRQGAVVLTSFDELDDALGLLPQPAWIPDGYIIKSLSASYSAEEYQLADQTRYPAGISVYLYRGVQPFPSGYSATYENAAGDQLFYSARLDENSDAMDFGMYDGDTVERIEIDGMDDALLFNKEGSGAGREWRLYARRELAEPVPYKSMSALFGEDYWLPEWDEPYTEPQVTITATALTDEELVKVFAGE